MGTTGKQVGGTLIRSVGWAMVILGIAGCAGLDPMGSVRRVRPALLFDPNTTLAYTFVSDRDIAIQWEPQAESENADRTRHTLTERLTLKMTYRPVEVTSDHVVLRSTCTSARVRRTRLNGRPDLTRDPVEQMTGETFHLTLDRRGRLRDANELDALLKTLGQKAFRARGEMRIKDPEMIADVVATQWFLWDAIASMDPNGVVVGDTWSSRLSVALPMVMREARDVTYTLAHVNDGIALIDSTFTHSQDKAPSGWPIPYAGTFNVSGPFGFLRGFQLRHLQGTGQERFDLERGLSLGYEHTYRVELTAMTPFGFRVMPKIIIEQTLTMTPTAQTEQ